MLNNARNNVQALARISKAIGNLNSDVVFIGGTVVGLYIDNPSAEDIRVTMDVDVVFQVTTAMELEEIRESLNERGFFQSPEDSIICRFHYAEDVIDILSTEPVSWAPSNRWFQPGLANSIDHEVEGATIKLLPLPYFLATKLDAFFDRGINDPMLSTDLEDIVYVLNHVSDVVDQIRDSDQRVQDFLKESFYRIFEERRIVEAIYGHLLPASADKQFEQIRQKIRELID